MNSRATFAAYMRSLSDLLEICKSSAATLEGAQACLYDAPELSHLRLMFPSVKGFTPLHEASARGHADIVDFLIDSKADVNATTFIFMQNSDDSKETPMHLAAANGHSRVVASLVRAGADIGALSAKGASALHLSFGSDGKQHLDVVRVIVEEMIAMSKIRSNCDSINRIINSADGFNCSPLHAAAKGGSLPIVQLLLSVKTVDVNKTNIYGQTPLHVASTHGHSWAVRAIAKYRECGVNVRMQEKARDSCLHLAAKRGHVNVLIELGAAGAHLLNEIKDSTGRIKSLHIISNDSSDRLSPIDVAQGDQARNFLEKAVDIFRLCQGEHVGSGGMGIKSILADPDTRQSFLSFRTSSNNTPLHIAVKSQNIEGLNLIY